MAGGLIRKPNKGVLHTALVAFLSAAAACPVAAQTGEPQLAIMVGEPEGFSNLTESRMLLVDVYYGGVRRGEARVEIDPGSVRFVAPADTVALLPALTDSAAIEAALSADSLPSNTSLICSIGSDPGKCGSLQPEVVGVIFDREHFRIDIFLNPRFIAIRDSVSDSYLPAPQEGITMIHTLGAVVSGQSGDARDYYNFQDNMVIGDGEKRLRASVAYSSRLGFGADRAYFEWDRPGLRYSAGMMWAPGNDVFGQRKLLGAGIETQIDTRLDRDVLQGSPIVVYLEQRARVDVIRDGRVLNSAIYEAGNQQIDTSSLPDGSYSIVLRIEEPGRPPREERRFYTRSRNIPSPGRTNFYTYAGLLFDRFDRDTLDLTGRPYGQAGVSHRLTENWVVEAGVEGTDLSASGEVAATYLTDIVRVRTGVVANTTGAYGGILQLMSSGNHRFNFNFDMRHIESRDASRPLSIPSNGGMTGDYPATALDGSFSQAGGVVSYSLANMRFLATFYYRDDPTLDERYSVGPSIEWDVVRKGPLTLTMRGDITATERGESGFAGLSLRFLGPRTSLSGQGGYRGTNVPGDDLGEGSVGSVSAAWNPSVGDSDVSLAAGFDHQPRRDNFIASTELRHRLVNIAGDVVHTDGRDSTATQYTLGMQTTLVAGGGQVQLEGDSTSESLIVARVDGASETDRFDVFVDNQLHGTIEGSRPYSIALPPYRAYEVRIRPTGEGLLAYDGTPRTASLYPGSIARLDWTVSPITIRFGQLVQPDGTPIRGASITGAGIWSETDDNGNFQIEAPESAALEVTLRDGRTFAAVLPQGKTKGGIARLGAVICCGQAEVQLGSLGKLPAPAKGGKN